MSETDKFKVNETAPFYSDDPMDPTDSYSSGSFRSEYVLKFKDRETKSVIKSSGIVGNNNKIPPATKTILTFSQLYDTSFLWSGVTWTRDNTLPDFSYTASVPILTGILTNSGKLTSVVIGTSATSIGDSAFSACVNLTSITIPKSVTSIGASAFNKDSKLTSIIIPIKVTSIGISAFGGCTGLTSITIPTSVTSIGDDAFNSCTALTSITIPNSITSIGTDAFELSGLTTVYISANNPLGITSPSSNVDFYGAIGVETKTPT